MAGHRLARPSPVCRLQLRDGGAGPGSAGAAAWRTSRGAPAVASNCRWNGHLARLRTRL